MYTCTCIHVYMTYVHCTLYCTGGSVSEGNGEKTLRVTLPLVLPSSTHSLPLQLTFPSLLPSSHPVKTHSMEVDLAETYQVSSLSLTHTHTHTHTFDCLSFSFYPYSLSLCLSPPPVVGGVGGAEGATQGQDIHPSLSASHSLSLGTLSWRQVSHVQ